MMGDSQPKNSEQPTNNTPNNDSSIHQMSVSRFDAILAGIPLLLGTGIFAGGLGLVSFQIGVVIAAVVSCLLLVDALFIHPPTDSGEVESQGQATESDVGHAAD